MSHIQNNLVEDLMSATFPSEIVSSDGRKFALRALDPADMLDLIEAAGSAANSASLSAWLNQAQIICSVTAIDGVPVRMPSSKEEVKDLARRLGNDGFVSVYKAIYPEKPSADEEPDSEMAVAKN